MKKRLVAKKKPPYLPPVSNKRIESGKTPLVQVTLKPNKYAFIFPNHSPISAIKSDLIEEKDMFTEVSSFLKNIRVIRKMQ